MRQGPHHGAHRSTRTGRAEPWTCSANVASSASATHGRGWWQVPHRGTPDAAAGTRFFRPQLGHTTIEVVMTAWGRSCRVLRIRWRKTDDEPVIIEIHPDRGGVR